MKLRRHQTQLLKHIALYPDFAIGLHTHKVERLAGSLIEKGLLDEKWQITADGKRQLGLEAAEEQDHAIEQPVQFPGSSSVAQLDSAVNQAEQLRDQQIQQQYGDQFGVYVQEKAEQIDRLQSNLAEALTSERAQLQAISTDSTSLAGRQKAHAQWEQQVARRKTRIAQIALRLDRVGDIEEAAGVYAERKIEELAEHKLRFDEPEPAQEWDKIERRERQAAIPEIERSPSIEEELVQTLTLSRTSENE